jgi:hypothetical protein
MREQRTRELAGTTEEDDLTWDDEREIRYSLTALGESILSERDPMAPSFRGFGPCVRA